MSKMRLLVVFVVLAFVAFGANAMAAENPAKVNTNTDSMLGVASTTSQQAVFAAFLSDIGNGADANTAISVSNILITPPSISGITNGNFSDTQGTITVYLYGFDGTSYVYDTGSNPGVGSGLNGAGELEPGRTWAVFLSDIMNTMSVDNFVGFGWFVANFDSVAGTYTNFFVALDTPGFAGEMQPPLGGIPIGND